MTTQLVKILEEVGIADRHLRVHPLVAGLGEIVLTIADKRKSSDEKLERIENVVRMLKGVLVNNKELVSTLKMRDVEKILRVIRELRI